MLANWMLYCATIGVLLSGGALALEKAVRPLRPATRWVWAAALLLTLAVPAAMRFAAAPRAAAKPVAAPTVAYVPGGDAGPSLARRPRPWWRDAVDARRLQAPLAALWGGSSAAVVLALGAMGFALRRRRRGWSAHTVDGVPVLVSDDTGPAVVGLMRGRIVLPAWALAADDDARLLVLEHEQEHLRAGDPRLLAGGLLVAVLMPWNPAVWWQLRRLRLAVEVDCDARVLRRRAGVHAYGSVLLEMGRRARTTRLAAAAAFAEPVSTLERRIRIMTAPRVRRPVLRAAALGAVTAALVVAACEAPAPTQPSPGGARAVYSASPQAGLPRSPLSTRALLREYYPDVLRHGMEPGDVVVFVLSADGAVIDHALLSPTLAPDASAADARAAQSSGVGRALQRYASQVNSMNVVKSLPGELGPTEVRVAIAQLKATPADAGEARADLSGAERVATADRALATTAEPRDAERHLSPEAAREEAERVAFRAAVARHYPADLRAAGVTGRIALRMNIGDDGRPSDIVVVRGDERFADAARAVAADLVYRNRGDMVMVIDFAPERRPAADVLR